LRGSGIEDFEQYFNKSIIAGPGPNKLTDVN